MHGTPHTFSDLVKVEYSEYTPLKVIFTPLKPSVMVKGLFDPSPERGNYPFPNYC